MEKITQEMKYHESIVKYAKAKGVIKVERKYNRARSYIFYWWKRYDGTLESLRGYSKKPKSYPKQHRVDQKRFLNDRRFYNFEDFRTLLRKYNQSSNNIRKKP